MTVTAWLGRRPLGRWGRQSDPDDIESAQAVSPNQILPRLVATVPHNVQAALLLSCAIPQWETVRWLLLEVQQLASTPRSFNRAAVSLCEMLPSYLPIWVLSFWDRLSKAYDTCWSWRSLDWVNAVRSMTPPLGLDGMVPCKIVCLKTLDKKYYLFRVTSKILMTKSSLAADPLMTDDT